MSEKLKNGWLGFKMGLIGTAVMWSSWLILAAFMFIILKTSGKVAPVPDFVRNFFLIVGLAFPLLGGVFGLLLSFFVK